MTTTFETAKVGDRVWSLQFGWGEISKINDDPSYPIVVEYDRGGFDTFTLDCRLDEDHVTQSIFWDEVVIEAPTKPLPDLEVDAKVLVWNDTNEKNRRHFSHFSNGRIYTFDNGTTSFTRLHAKSMTGWPYWELAE